MDEAKIAAIRANAEDTTDQAAERVYLRFVQEIEPQVALKTQALKSKLLSVEGFEPQADHRELLRRFRSEAKLFRDVNVPLQADVDTRANDYNKITGAMTVMLGGEELTLQQAGQRLLDPDRAIREEAWRAMDARRSQDREALNVLFLDLLTLRRQIARNAGLADYRAYRWREFKRFNYTPEDALALDAAIEAEVVPPATHLLQRRRAQLRLATVRPWDVDVDEAARPPLKPFNTAEELEAGVARIFTQLDPELGAQFERMRDGFLDLGSRKGKAPGGFCGFFPRTGMPYIFMNAVGTHEDVVILLHESGHTFHARISNETQPLIWNLGAPIEFAEVASTAMELLGTPYLAALRGGFYTPEEAQRALSEQLKSIIDWLPYGARGDAFQHWLYTEAPEHVTAADVDAKWDELTLRFLPGVDWSGLETSRAAGWQRTPHFFLYPFYYIEYALAHFGALQIWRNALHDQTTALRQYRVALALGNTRPLPELYRAAGASLVFDRATVGELVEFLAMQLGLASMSSDFQR